MSDRELLELAAKAAGISAQWDAPERGLMMLSPSGIDTITWNPLTDDGDALRLAVTLGLCVGKSVDSKAWCASHNSMDSIIYEAGDPYAATRRAIVRAAAEIGRAMP